MRKNIASQVVSFQAVSSTDGSAVTTGTPTVYVTIDGAAQTTGGGVSTHEGQGQWSYVPTQAETNGNHVAFTFTLTGAINQCVNVWPVSFDPTDSADLGLTSLTGHTPQTGDSFSLIGTAGIGLTNLGGSGNNWNVGKTGYSLTQSFPTNFADLAITATTGQITVGTNNDKTGYTVSSVTDKTGYSLTAVTGLGNQTANITGNLSGSVGSNLELGPAEVAAELATYDAPTKAEMDAAFTEIKGATWSSISDTLEVISGNISIAQLDLDTITDTDGVVLGAAGVDLIWDEVITAVDHNVNTSAAKFLREASSSVAGLSGTAQAGGPNTITLASGAITATDILNGERVSIIDGTGAGQSRLITNSVITTDVVTVAHNWTTQPDVTSVYTITGAEVDVRAIAEDATAANNLLLDYDGTGYNKANSTIGTTTLNTDMRGTDNAATEAKQDIMDANVDLILEDTGITLPARLDGIEGATFNTATDSLEAIRERGDLEWTTGAGGTPPQLLQSTTIATLTSQTSFTLTAGSADDNAYAGAVVVVTDSLTATQKAVGSVSSYTGSTKRIILTADPGIFAMDVGDSISIIANASTAPSAAAVRAEIDSNSTQLALIVSDLGTAQADLDIITDVDGVVLGAAGVDLIWDEELTAAEHNVTNSAGRRLRTSAEMVIRAEQAQGGGINYITLDAGASAVANAYDPSTIYIVSGTGAGQCRLIMQYDSTTKQAYVDRDWKQTPDATSQFVISAHPGREHVNEGLAQAGGASTIRLNALASAVDNVYNGQRVFIRAGTGADQAALVTAYNGITKDATITPAWAVQPDATSVYAMLPNSPVKLSADTQATIDALPTAVEVRTEIDSNSTELAALQNATHLNKQADHIIRRNSANARASADGDAVNFRSALGAISKLTNKVGFVASDLVTREEDDSTAFGTQAATTNAAAEPITDLDTV